MISELMRMKLQRYRLRDRALLSEAEARSWLHLTIGFQPQILSWHHRDLSIALIKGLLRLRLGDAKLLEPLDGRPALLANHQDETLFANVVLLHRQVEFPPEESFFGQEFVWSVNTPAYRPLQGELEIVLGQIHTHQSSFAAEISFEVGRPCDVSIDGIELAQLPLHPNRLALLKYHLFHEVIVAEAPARLLWKNILHVE